MGGLFSGFSAAFSVRRFIEYGSSQTKDKTSSRGGTEQRKAGRRTQQDGDEPASKRSKKAEEPRRKMRLSVTPKTTAVRQVRRKR